MNQRTERMSAEIQSVLGGILIRGEIRDSRVRDAGLVTITGVRVSGDLSEARVAFTVFGANEAALEQVRRGLQAARNYLQGELGRQLRTRKTALLKFEVDRGLDNAFRVDSLLREEAAASAALPAGEAQAGEAQAGEAQAGEAQTEDDGGDDAGDGGEDATEK